MGHPQKAIATAILRVPPRAPRLVDVQHVAGGLPLQVDISGRRIGLSTIVERVPLTRLLRTGGSIQLVRGCVPTVVAVGADKDAMFELVLMGARLSPDVFTVECFKRWAAQQLTSPGDAKRVAIQLLCTGCLRLGDVSDVLPNIQLEATLRSSPKSLRALCLRQAPSEWSALVQRALWANQEAAAMVLQTRLNSTSQDLDTLLAQMNSFTLAVTARSHHSSHLRTS